MIWADTFLRLLFFFLEEIPATIEISLTYVEIRHLQLLWEFFFIVPVEVIFTITFFYLNIYSQLQKKCITNIKLTS